MRVGLSVGILFFAAAQLMPTALMRIFTSEQAIIEEGVKYLRIVSWSYPLAAAAVVYLNIMRSVERVIISTLVYSASLVVNVIFNAIFIFGLGPAPAMGVSGAACATVIAHVAECGIVLVYILKVHPEVHFRPSLLFVREKELMKDFRIYALPVILNELAWGTGLRPLRRSSAIWGALLWRPIPHPGHPAACHGRDHGGGQCDGHYSGADHRGAERRAGAYLCFEACEAERAAWASAEVS